MIFEPTAPNLNPFIKLYPYNKFFSNRKTELFAPFFVVFRKPPDSLGVQYRLMPMSKNNGFPLGGSSAEGGDEGFVLEYS